MQFTPYLHFNGCCEEALSFYSKHMNIEIKNKVPFSAMPGSADIPENWEAKIMHCEWSIDGQTLMACDPPPNMYQQPEGFTINLMVDSVEEAEKLFQSLADGGSVYMPMSESFFAHRFGMLRDRFNIPWMINFLKEC